MFPVYGVVLMLLLVSVCGFISVPAECSNDVASVVLPTEQRTYLSITADLPLQCWSMEVDPSNNILVYEYEVLNQEFVDENNAYVRFTANSECNAVGCEEVATFSTTTGNCVENIIPGTSTRVPFTVSLVNQDSGDLFLPNETITVEIMFRWEEECAGSSNWGWLYFFLGSLLVGIVVLVAFALVFVYLKKKTQKPLHQQEAQSDGFAYQEEGESF